eukprot:TRINITY_DN989_c1_g4_i1.p1 TRINITY_DN989_c1_g4~~TRINITY_DN989_c1_g4_i1.p1  ORF type:complete len:262 (-),score=15.65 TRINITY_DN989_c1_g4_i1:115-900(-)
MLNIAIRNSFLSRLFTLLQTTQGCNNMACEFSGKEAAAKRAIIEHVKDGQIVGIGSGSTIVFGVLELARLVTQEKLNVKCIPTSFQSQQLILQNNLPLTSLEQHPVVDVTFDGADEIDPNLSCIKGGGGCLTQEKIVSFFATTSVIMADSSKLSERLGTNWKKGLPIEVLPLAYKPIQTFLESTYGGIAVLRMAVKKVGPLVTDNGNFILDWEFPLDVDLTSAADRLLRIPGVLEHGLFVGMVDFVYLGNQDGSVKLINKQ